MPFVTKHKLIVRKVTYKTLKIKSRFPAKPYIYEKIIFIF